MQKKENFVEKHLAFILTILITYVLGILLVVAQYIVGVKTGNEENFFEILLDSMIPTTITYMLGCVVVNIVEMFYSGADHCVFNIITCVLIFMYAIVFTWYMLLGFSIWWIIIEFVTTALLLILNIFCYKEKYQHRNHTLV